VRISLKWMQQSVANVGRDLLAWMAIPLRRLETCTPIRCIERRQTQPEFTWNELPPEPRQAE